MKKYLLILLLLGFTVPVFAAESDTYSIESVRSFARPNDSRFQYTLPDRGSFRIPKKSSTAAESLDDDVIELDTSDVKPVKKVVKTLSADYDKNQNKFDNSQVPMNYDSFPRYFDPNDLGNQQFMPMMGF